MERHSIIKGSQKTTSSKVVRRKHPSLKHPKISVVIPAHNEALVIGPTIEAILRQTYPNFEIIVVNNASSDNTAEVVAMFPVKLVHESKKGLLFARDRGRKEAGGEIVANIDADCLPEIDWMEKAVKYFENVDVVAVSGPYNYHDAHPFFKHTSFFVQSYIYKTVAHILQWSFIRGGAVIIGGNNMIRADILKEMGGYNTALLFYGEDTDTAKRVAKYGYVIFTPKVAMKTSARRFKSEGTIKMTLRYLFHFFKHTFKTTT